MYITLFILLLAFVTSTYILFRRLTRKLKTIDNTNKRIYIILTIIIFGVGLYVLVIIIWILSNSYYTEKDFNREIWNKNATERYKMSKNIIDSKMLIGKKHDEVIEILGNDYIINNDSNIIYELGVVPELFNIDPSYLDIKLKKGKVVDVTQIK